MRKVGKIVLYVFLVLVALAAFYAWKLYSDGYWHPTKASIRELANEVELCGKFSSIRGTTVVHIDENKYQLKVGEASLMVGVPHPQGSPKPVLPDVGKEVEIKIL